jgi:predicted DNA-binding protein (MmcQ/YjbR family)
VAKPSARDHVRAFALGLPEAWEDFPWGERVVKVGKKIFVFLGTDDGDQVTMSVKLAESNHAAVGVPGAVPTGYGLGRAGWVTVPLDGNGVVALPVMEDWVEESYRMVALKRLVRLLDARPTD